MLGIVAHALPSLALSFEGGHLSCVMLSFLSYRTRLGTLLVFLFPFLGHPRASTHYRLGLAVHKSVLYAYLVNTKAMQSSCSYARMHHLSPSQRSCRASLRRSSGHVETAIVASWARSIRERCAGERGGGRRGNPDARLSRPDRWRAERHAVASILFPDLTTPANTDLFPRTFATSSLLLRLNEPTNAPSGLCRCLPGSAQPRREDQAES